MIRCFTYAGMLLGLCGAVFAEQPADPDATQHSNIHKRPLDFSQPPVLPKIDKPSSTEIAESIDLGVAFLVESQRESGAWGAATKTKALNIFAPVPGAHDAFRIATTALCVSALCEIASTDKKAIAALDRGEAWLLLHLPDLRRATGQAVYNVWGHGYSIQALLRMRQRHAAGDPKLLKAIDGLVNDQFDMLRRYESVDGGWGYYDFRYQAQRPTSSSISFVNAAVLIALHEAKEAGFEPPERIVKRALAATKRQQKADFSYLYGEYLKDRPMREINRPGGSLGRTQCCNCALRAWGDEKITDNVVKNWLYRLYVRNGWLDIGRKRPVPHESWMQVAGYFYYFGHYYAALSMEQLPEDQRADYQPLLARLMLDRQEKNGCWWDYPLYDYHQQYGTAMALMTLVRCH